MSAQEEISFQDIQELITCLPFWLESICGKLVYLFLYLLFFMSFQNFWKLFSQGENVLCKYSQKKSNQLIILSDESFSF